MTCLDCGADKTPALASGYASERNYGHVDVGAQQHTQLGCRECGTVLISRRRGSYRLQQRPQLLPNTDSSTDADPG